MPWKKIIVNVHGFSVLQQNFNRADITFLTKIFLGRDKKSYARDIPLLPGFLFPLLSSTLPGPSASEVTTLWQYTNTQ